MNGCFEGKLIMELGPKFAIRKFVSEENIRNVLEGEFVRLVNEAGEPLPDIYGRAGVACPTMEGVEIGADLIEMQPGSAFPLHIHPGQHILYIIRGEGIVHVDGVDHHIKEGDTIFIPAEYPHGVKTFETTTALPLTLLAIGYPHKDIEATDRMRIVDPLVEGK